MNIKDISSEARERYIHSMNDLLHQPLTERHKTILAQEEHLEAISCYLDDVVITAACSAIIAYHNQLRESLKKQGIDIGSISSIGNYSDFS